MAEAKLPKYERGQRSLSADGFNTMSRAIASLQASNKKQYQAKPPLIKNTTGDKLEAFSILSAKELTFDPSENAGLISFKGARVYEGQAPTVDDGALTTDKDSGGNSIAVITEEAADGRWVQCKTDGLVQCKIEVTDERHEWADIANDDTEKLHSGVAGTAYIYDVESGKGTKWGLVLLNAHHHGQSNNPQTDLSTENWKINDQGEVEGKPATGAKFSLIIVDDESYTPGSNETLKTFQIDSLGHVIEVGAGGDSSSSQSTGEEVSSDSTENQSSGFMSSKSSAFDSSVSDECASCAYDKVSVTVSDCHFTDCDSPDDCASVMPNANGTHTLRYAGVQFGYCRYSKVLGTYDGQELIVYVDVNTTTGAVYIVTARWVAKSQCNAYKINPGVSCGGSVSVEMVYASGDCGDPKPQFTINNWF